MIFEGFSVGPMDSNCYILGCEKTLQAVVVDPGDEGRKILKRLEELKLKCTTIILTHGHVDHIGALKEVQSATGASVMIHTGDADMLTSPSRNLSAFMGGSIKLKEADRLLNDGDIIEVGTLKIKVMHTPGHTLGGICLEAEGRLITGDTLFAGSIGRSDFPGGNHNQLIASIKSRLLDYPPQTQVYPGHGPASTIGSEIKHNPFLS